MPQELLLPGIAACTCPFYCPVGTIAHDMERTNLSFDGGLVWYSATEGYHRYDLGGEQRMPKHAPLTFGSRSYETSSLFAQIQSITPFLTTSTSWPTTPGFLWGEPRCPPLRYWGPEEAHWPLQGCPPCLLRCYRHLHQASLLAVHLIFPQTAICFSVNCPRCVLNLLIFASQPSVCFGFSMPTEFQLLFFYNMLLIWHGIVSSSPFKAIVSIALVLVILSANLIDNASQEFCNAFCNNCWDNLWDEHLSRLKTIPDNIGLVALVLFECPSCKHIALNDILQNTRTSIGCQVSECP